VNPGDIKVKDFGADHWSTFAFLAAAEVGRDGEFDLRRMRVDAERHLHLTGEDPRLPVRVGKCPPTRIKGGEVSGHDDFDCAHDLVEAGLLVATGSGLHPGFRMTDDGWKVLRALLEHRRTGGTFAGFAVGGLVHVPVIDRDGGAPRLTCNGREFATLNAALRAVVDCGAGGAALIEGRTVSYRYFPLTGQLWRLRAGAPDQRMKDRKFPMPQEKRRQP
jgi:hypothetical protein